MKWWQVILIIIVAGVVFYMLYPKYYFMSNGRFRGNRITGKVEIRRGGRWGEVR